MCCKKGVATKRLIVMPSGVNGWCNTKALQALSVVWHWVLMGNPHSQLNKQLLITTWSRARCQLSGQELWLYYSQLRLPQLVAKDWLTFQTRNTPFIQWIRHGLCNLEWLDDIMMMSYHYKLMSQQELMMSHDITIATMVDYSWMSS